MSKYGLFISCLLSALGVCASSAEARQVMPARGNPADGTDRSCFDFPDWNHPARMMQSCTGTRNYLIGMPSDVGDAGVTTSGYLAGRAGFTSDTGVQPLECFVVTASLNGETGHWLFGTRNNLTWGGVLFNGDTNWSILVPPNGTMHAYCVMPQNSGLSSFMAHHVE
jgi:hypothetical protein